jgi:hypothetical protein
MYRLEVIMEKAKEVEGTEKKIRQRSPNYPAVGLREAVERVRKLYARDGKAGAPDKLAAVHIGFASAHGQAMAVLAALKRFGLIEPSNGRMIPTQRAIEIINLPEADPRRLQALKEAALSPAVYSELAQKHKDTGFPADDVLQSELVTYKGFNRSAVAGFVKDFKDTLEFAGLTDLSTLKSRTDDGSPKFDVGDYVQWISQGAEQFEEQRKITGFSEAGDFVFVEGSQTGIPVEQVIKCDAPLFGKEDQHMPEAQVSPAPQRASIQPLMVGPPGSKPVGASIPVTRECSMTVLATGPVTQKGIDQLMAYLKLVKDSFPEQ